MIFFLNTMDKAYIVSINVTGKKKHNVDELGRIMNNSYTKLY